MTHDRPIEPLTDSPPLSPLELRIAVALFAVTWVEEQPDQPTPDWHHQFQWWQAKLAARIAAAVVTNHE